MTKRFRAVDVTNPPRMTTAIGYSISCPGMFPLTTSGSNASAAQEAVIKMGSSRSSAPRRASSLPKATPSLVSKCR